MAKQWPNIPNKEYKQYTSTPQLPFKIPHIPTSRDHKALNRATLGGLGRVHCFFSHFGGPGSSLGAPEFRQLFGSRPSSRRLVVGAVLPTPTLLRRSPRFSGVFRISSHQNEIRSQRPYLCMATATSNLLQLRASPPEVVCMCPPGVHIHRQTGAFSSAKV